MRDGARRDDRLGDREPSPRASGDRDPRLRRVAPRWLRLVLPQRDRPAARDAGGHPGRHDGGVRHRLRRRHRLAAFGRARREGADHHRRARRDAGRPRPPRSSATTRSSRCSPPTGRRCSTRVRTRCSSSTPASRPRSVSTPWPTSSRTAASSCSTTSPRARCGRPSPTGRVDTLREQWLTDDRFTTVEVMVAPDASTLIATRCQSNRGFCRSNPDAVDLLTELPTRA